jgi:phosphoglycolate phosphatase-like HAD superfamily hydrolase
MVLSQIRLLILDLDYLVYDCGALKAMALRNSLVSLADAIPQDVRLPDAVDAEEGFREHGVRWPVMLDLGLDEESTARIYPSYLSHQERLVSAGAGSLYPGLTDLLSNLNRQGIAIAIGAEAERDYLMAVSDRHELDRFFEMAYCTEEFGMGRAEEMFEEIMTRAEVNRSETLVLGTRPDFFQSARVLGLSTLGCGWGLQRPESIREADLHVKNLAQAYAALEQADGLAAQDVS